jgi:hypothetical protein
VNVVNEVCFGNEDEACITGPDFCPQTSYSDCSSFGTGCYLYELSDCTSCVCEDFWVYACDGAAWRIVSCKADSKFVCPSDERLKEEIETLDGALDKLLQLNPVEFDWSEDTPEYQEFKDKGKLHSIGFIAQEVKKIYPELVELRGDGYYTVHYSKINAILVEGIKEQQVFIEDLEKTIINLEKYFDI